MNWKDSYSAALIEVNPTKLLILIHETETAITVRSESLPKVSNRELQAMNDATWTLRFLKNNAVAEWSSSGL